MKRPLSLSIVTVIVIVALGILWYLTFSPRQTTETRVGIVQIVSQPLLDATRKGFIDRMAELGYLAEKNVTYDYQNAEGDQSVAVQIIKKFVTEDVSLIFALGTAAAQAAVKETKTIPVVFGAITDPVESKLAESLSKPGGNKTGTSDRWPYERQVALIKKLVPTAKKVGIVLNPGESNTVASMQHIRPALAKEGLEGIEAPVSNTAEVLTAASTLVGRCDALLVPADNTVIAAMASMVKVANENRIPLFVGDIRSVETGALATYGNDYYSIGKKSAEIAVKVLRENVQPGSIPVGLGTDVDLVINLKAAEKQGVSVPESLLSQAKRVIR